MTDERLVEMAHCLPLWAHLKGSYVATVATSSYL
jgi:hypothetical protein